MAIADFRLYDRSISTIEVTALFDGPLTKCCVSAGLNDAFGVTSIDLTAQASSSPLGTTIAITPSATRSKNTGTSIDATSCMSTVDQNSNREHDICGEATTVSDCNGIISDGIGPYDHMLDCGLRLHGFIGSTYTLSFDEFETETRLDLLRIFDGSSVKAPLLGQLSGHNIPSAIMSTGHEVYLQFSSDDTNQAAGFRLSFRCTGTLVDYWKPADVAVSLEVGTMSTEQFQQDSQRTKCLSSVLMSVQCCADATMSCKHARVTAVDLSAHMLRGSTPAAMGSLSALRSLKLYDNFLTGTL
jgi:hypothetical protein